MKQLAHIILIDGVFILRLKHFLELMKKECVEFDCVLSKEAGKMKVKPAKQNRESTLTKLKI